ncbi:hypothetical protein ACJRO7_004456 [Eucalyptus globulus]|uniref:Uncharacterized protein n=1 Tax=Eucalyptus globulus TaxID=34317 RepID=A0ABD3IWL9_EUCGL
MQKGSSFGLRKGSWTEEEDVLLRSCVQRYGEGEWHRVPQRAGLNRWRKSCRLRWLNYLKPNIKRGKFEDDENYWNAHQRKLMTCQGKPENKKPQDLVKVEVIRPRPRTISKNFSSLGVEAYRELNKSREPRVHDVPPNRSPWINDDFELRSETTEAWLDCWSGLSFDAESIWD